MEELKLTQEWDKTFAKSEKVDHSKVTFPTRYGFTLAADLYIPKDAEGEMPAVVTCGPYGAVKEQSSGLYAQTLAERGYITLAFDPSYTGESSGYPRNTTSPEINTEDYSAAIDYLMTRDDIDENKVAILGVCGWGGIALSAAYADPRIKATVCATSANLHIEAAGPGREMTLAMMSQQRTAEARGAEPMTMFSVPAQIKADDPQPVKDFYNYYRNPERGYHPRAINSGIAVSLNQSRGYTIFPLDTYIDKIENAVLMVHGDQAMSLPAAKGFFEKLKGDNKEFYTVLGAVHTDLYDGGPEHDKIPFDKIDAFLKEYLK